MKNLLRLLAALLPLGSFAAPISDAHIAAHLERWEGRKSIPYQDGKHFCVGVGHKLTGLDDISRAYSKDEIAAFLSADVAAAHGAARAAFPSLDSQPEEVQEVCIGLAFCCGRTGLMKFRNLRLAISRSYYNGAATELSLSKWVRQVSPHRANAYVLALAHAQP